MLLTDLLSRAAARFPEKPAVVFDGDSATFAELDRRSRAVAADLHLRGVGRGDSVALRCDNSLDAVVAFWAVLRCGASTVDLPPSASEAVIAHVLRETKPKAFVIQPRLLKRVAPWTLPSCPKLLVSIGDPLGADATAAGFTCTTIDEMSGCTPALDDIPAAAPSDVALVIYTSGTTSAPKGVMLTHENLLFNVEAFNGRVGLTQDDSLLLVAPLNYIHGRIQLLTFAGLGATIFFSAGFQFPATVLQELVRLQPTTFSGVPFHFSALLTSTKLKSTPLPSLRNLMLTGGAPSPATLRDLHAAVPQAAIHLNYGLTESSPRLTYHGPTEEVLARPSSCGRALPGVTLEIVGADGASMAAGEVGEVVASGAGIMRGYVSGDERSSGRIDDAGRLWTGDLGYLDADGYLHLAGRSSEMIKCAGERVFPREIETVLLDHAGIAECAVVGVPDSTLGERVVAFVVPVNGSAPSAALLRAHCLQSLPLVRAPREFHTVEQLPKTPPGKVRRAALRDLWTAAPHKTLAAAS